MQEISLNILDIVQNSIKADATEITITIDISIAKDYLKVIIKDNGKGMNEEELEKAKDPFFSTRNTRKVGLGIPFFKYAAESTGGSFSISSKLGQGTCLSAHFAFSHIDRMPLGDIVSTIHLLITINPHIHFLYTYKLGDRTFFLDTCVLEDILGDLPFNTPEVSAFIKEYLRHHHDDINANEYI